MTRRASGLDQREPTPVVEIHPDDARALGVADGDPVRLTSRRNSMVSSCRVSERVARGQVFVPFHFRDAAANLLTNPLFRFAAASPKWNGTNTSPPATRSETRH